MAQAGVIQKVVMDGLDAIEDVSWSALSRLGRAFHAKDGSQAGVLDAIVTRATETIESASFASINLLIRGHFIPQAAAGKPPHILDTFQQQTSQGPCVDASRDQVTVRIDDMAEDGRWPDFARLAFSLGVLGMLCVPLWVDQLRVGSLSLYATDRASFTKHHEGLADLFATHAALAIAEAQRTEQLTTAMTNRDVIGMAKGILIERHRLSPERAFEILSSSSQRVNRKLVEVALELVTTGELPTA
jgi:GAF domain-containing protein